MSKIIVYEDYNYKGRVKEFSSDVANLLRYDFNDIISSVEVKGRPWVAYKDCHFRNTQYIFEEGKHNVPENDVISSLQIVTDDLSNPQITLYEKPNYQGKSIVLKAETCLCDVNFNDITSSHKVQRGAWVLYEHGNRGGEQMVARGNVPDYKRLNNQVTHVRPLKGGK